MFVFFNKAKTKYIFGCKRKFDVDTCFEITLLQSQDFDTAFPPAKCLISMYKT